MFHFLYKVLRSFTFAGTGIISALRERNMKVHVMVLVAVIVFGFWIGLSQLEWVLIAVVSGLVLAAEMVNTAVEELSDIVRDELKLDYGATTRARDVAAGAVLVLAMVAAIVGLMIFVPKLVSL